MNSSFSVHTLSFSPLFTSHHLQPTAPWTYSALSHEVSGVFLFSGCSHRAARSNLTARICPVLAQDVHFSSWVAQQFLIACSLGYTQLSGQLEGGQIWNNVYEIAQCVAIYQSS